MTEELLQQAMGLFDTAEKWNAFVELSYNKNEIANRWWKNLQRELVKQSCESGYSEWTFDIWNAWDIQWRLKKFQNTYIAVHSWAGFNYRLWIRNADEDRRNRIYTLLDTERFVMLKSMPKLVNLNRASNEVVRDAHFQFDFSDSCDSNWSKMVEMFAWRAGNDTENMARQIMGQVNRFRTPEMTSLFEELNEELNGI